MKENFTNSYSGIIDIEDFSTEIPNKSRIIKQTRDTTTSRQYLKPINCATDVTLNIPISGEAYHSPV